MISEDNDYEDENQTCVNIEKISPEQRSQKQSQLFQKNKLQILSDSNLKSEEIEKKDNEHNVYEIRPLGSQEKIQLQSPRNQEKKLLNQEEFGYVQNLLVNPHRSQVQKSLFQQMQNIEQQLQNKNNSPQSKNLSPVQKGTKNIMLPVLKQEINLVKISTFQDKKQVQVRQQITNTYLQGKILSKFREIRNAKSGRNSSKQRLLIRQLQCLQYRTSRIKLTASNEDSKESKQIEQVANNL